VIPPPGEVERAIARFPGRRVVVVGDVMLDRFVWGDVERISPEAPVPVVRIRRESSRLGGAANVAANLAALGATAQVVGVVGPDAAGRDIVEMLDREGIENRLVVVENRESTVKTRVLARAQQVVRVDRESDVPVPEAAAEEMRRVLLEAIEDADAVVLSDYAKGVVRGDVLAPVLARAAARGIPTVSDPKRPPFDAHRGVTVVKPNQAEAARATAMHVDTDEEAVAAAALLLDRLDVRGVLMTRGGRGMLLVERGRSPRFIQSVAREVYDVTGAGDTVVAVLALSLAAGADIGRAAELANLAGGIVVGKVGTATVSASEILDRVAAAGGVSRA
jgi:D-beta-D-heptose 7-phosphate kinase/D-beta-D-heptose 1-phosphate adenosyltransferase